MELTRLTTADLTDRPYNKSEHNRRLRNTIDRSRPVVEFEHRNISAALKGLGESWLTGYLPAFNVQMSLADAVARWLHRHPEFQIPAPHVNEPAGSHETRSTVPFVLMTDTLASNGPSTHDNASAAIIRLSWCAGRSGWTWHATPITVVRTVRRRRTRDLRA